jgi:MFS transporter, DHA1 family, multidrug resistance protein
MNKKRILLITLFLTPLINIGLDLYTPSLPAIAHAFHISHFTVKVSLFAYVIAFGVGQPIMGPLCDRFGRRGFVRAATVIYVLSSIGAANSHFISELIACRVIQGLCATTVGAALKGILLDTFEGQELAKANSYYSIGWSMTPIIAPAVGGYLQHMFNWPASFYFIALYTAAAATLVWIFLPETLIKHADHGKTRWPTIFRRVLTDKIFMAGALLLVVEFSILIIYYGTAPFIIQTQLHYNAAKYGEIMLLIGLAYFLGNWANRLALQYFDVKPIIFFGIIASLAVSLTMVLLNYILPLSIYLASIPVFLLFFFDGFIFANTMTLCLVRFKQYSATAGSLLGGVVSSFTAVVALVVNAANIHTLEFISIVYTALIVGMFWLYVRAFRFAEL